MSQENCVIFLPSNVRLTYVTKVVAKLLGCKSILKVGTCHVKGVKIKTCSEWPEHVDIIIKPNAKKIFSLPYIFEPDYYEAFYEIQELSCPLMLAFGNALINFFGGMVFYRSSTVGYKIADEQILALDNSQNRPTTTPHYEALQRRIHAVEALTQADVNAYNTLACYRTRGLSL